MVNFQPEWVATFTGIYNLTVPIEITPTYKNVTSTTTSTTFAIENFGGADRPWSIDSYPSWVTNISPTSGTLAENGTQTITVTFNQNTGTERTGQIEYSYYGVENAVTIRQYSKVTTSGTLTCNEIWRANNTITGDVIIPSNYSLTVVSGKTVYSNSGTEISVYGTLNADGVTFTHTSGIWDGIKFMSNSGGSITNSTIKYATYGTYCYYANPSISNNSYNNNTYAIYLYQSSPTMSSNYIIDDWVYLNRSNPNMTNNYINSFNYGIYFYYSSPVLYSNSVITTGTSPTVSSYYYSSPSFGSRNTTTKGYNYIMSDEGDVALLADNHSNPFLGGTVPCVPNTRIGGYNSIEQYHSSFAVACNDSRIDACWCWWGQYPVTINDPDVIYDYPLEEDPNGGSGLAKSTNVYIASIEDQSVLDREFNSEADSLSKWAFSYTCRDKYSLAIPILEQIILKYPNTSYSSTSISKIAQICQTEENFKLVDILPSLINETSDVKLKLVLSDLLINGYIDSKDYTKAISLADSIILNNANSTQEYTTLFNLFNIYHKDLENIPKASVVLNQMVKKYPGYDLTSIAQLDMGQKSVIVLGKNAFSGPEDDEEIDVIPTNFLLCSNYPNPFNSNTVIPFILPKESKVTIIVYDLIGRTIKTITDTYYSSGKHNVKWDGTDHNGSYVANGMYIYTMNAGKYYKSKKMIFLK